jgi:hypothetical protein
MAQTLYVKMKDGGQRPVKIIRSWLSNGGAWVYLHVGGRYAYKDGTPLRAAAELDALPPAQRAAALAWWRRTGEKESSDFYANQEAAAAALAGDFQSALPDSSELDAVLYTRRPKKRGSAVSAPHAWPDWFDARPDWWGQADVIGFPDFIYERDDAEEAKKGKAEKKADAPGETAGEAGDDPGAEA